MVFTLFVLGFVVVTIHVLDPKGASDESPAKIREEVTALFAGIPQHGATLGSPKAPVTLRVYADLECHTVRRFFLNHLPAILRTWVRSGRVKLEYRSLQTDTLWEPIFIRQEVAALAAGRQDKFWNFADSFIHEEGKEYTRYATDEFLERIASHVSGIQMADWKRARHGIDVFDQVVLGDHHARQQELSATPSFLIGPSGGEIKTPVGSNSEIGSLLNVDTLTPVVERIERERQTAAGLRE
jgi:protein-disulfide isomerase